MDLAGLFADSEEVRVEPAGTVIFAEDDPGDQMYVVLQGVVELRSGERVLAQLGPGELFGELALIDDQPRSSAAIAIDETKLATVDERQFLFLLHETPRFALHVMGVMADRLRASS